MSKEELRGGATRLSLFNIGLYVFMFSSPIFFLLPWDLNMAQGLFFVFGVFTLMGLALLDDAQRVFRGKFLGLMILWSLAGVFIHTFQFGFNKTNITGFINFALMSEGFIYVLCGCLLYWLVFSCSRRMNIFYPILAVSVLNLFFAITQKFGIYLIWQNIMQVSAYGNEIANISGLMGTKSQLAVFSAISFPILWHFCKPASFIALINLWLANSFTGAMALFLAIGLYLLLKREWRFLFVFFGLGTLLMIFYVGWEKLPLRPVAWVYTLKEIIQHPFIGWGFDNSTNGNKIFVRDEMVFRHNDYLNVARDLGLPFLGIIGVFIWNFFKGIKVDYLWVAIVTAGIACFFQTNFYFPRIAGIVIILMALKDIEKCRIPIAQQ